MKTKKHSTLFLLPKKYTRKSHHKKVKKHKKQKGGFFLESAAIILGMKYIINRKNINEEWKTGKKPEPKKEEKIVSTKTPLRGELTTQEVRNLIDPAREDIERTERIRRQDEITTADDDDIDASAAFGVVSSIQKNVIYFLDMTYLACIASLHSQKCITLTYRFWPRR